jgi:hypothetical protein
MSENENDTALPFFVSTFSPVKCSEHSYMYKSEVEVQVIGRLIDCIEVRYWIGAGCATFGCHIRAIHPIPRKENALYAGND